MYSVSVDKIINYFIHSGDYGLYLAVRPETRLAE